MNLVKPTKQKYCSYCGEEMTESLERADKCMMFYGDTPSIPVASRFNKETGKEQFCYKYVCPNWKKKNHLLFPAR